MASRLKLHDVMKELGELSLSSANIRELAFRLEVALTTLDDIDEQRRGTERNRYYIQAWLNGDPSASWLKIITTLKGMSLNRQAEDLSKSIASDPSFSAPSASGSAGMPTMPEMLRLKIPERAAGKASDFGILLLNDTQGSTTRNLETKHRGDSVAVVREILQLWLTGRGTAITWETLAETLRDVDLNVLAGEVEKYATEK